MNKNDIDILLHKYYRGETSLEEEQALRAGMIDDETDALLMKGMEQLSAEEPTSVPVGLERSLSDSIDRWQAEESRRHGFSRWRRGRSWAAVAACVLIAVTIGWRLTQNQPQVEQDRPAIVVNANEPQVETMTTAAEVPSTVAQEDIKTAHHKQLAHSAKPARRRCKTRPARAVTEPPAEPELTAAERELAMAALVKFSTVLNDGINHYAEASEIINQVNNTINQYITVE